MTSSRHCHLEDAYIEKYEGKAANNNRSPGVRGRKRKGYQESAPLK